MFVYFVHRPKGDRRIVSPLGWGALPNSGKCIKDIDPEMNFASLAVEKFWTIFHETTANEHFPLMRPEIPIWKKRLQGPSAKKNAPSKT